MVQPEPALITLVLRDLSDERLQALIDKVGKGYEGLLYDLWTSDFKVWFAEIEEAKVGSFTEFLDTIGMDVK